MDKNCSIYVAGHNGMAGSAILRRLQKEKFSNLVTASHRELDLSEQSAVRQFFTAKKIDYVVLAAAKVGGIYANNTYPAEFIYQNLMIESNVIHEAWRAGVNRLIFLASSCIYPRLSAQPMVESALLSGHLEPTNEPYAVAKIAGIKMCESYNRQYGTRYRSLMPTNLYGPGDNFHLENSHVIAALLRRFHDAKEARQAQVKIWGSGKVKREFLHVDDLASACVHIMSLDNDLYDANVSAQQSHINVGAGKDITIADCARLISNIVGYQGEIVFDTSKPDGTPRKLLDISLIKKLGWQPEIDLEPGLTSAYQWFVENYDHFRGC